MSQKDTFLFNKNTDHLPEHLVKKMEEEGRMIDKPLFQTYRVTNIINRVRRTYPDSRQQYPVTTEDVHYLQWLISLGVDIKQQDLDNSILQINTIPVDPNSYDFVIAPDARELSHNGRSQKSPPLPTWENIFRSGKIKHEGVRIGILQGNAHPQYCHEVAAIARHVGVPVEEIVTPTFDGLLSVIRSAGTFVGVDSGTTHLAVELAKHISSLNVKELFLSDNDTYSPDSYGISGIGTKGRIFALRRAVSETEKLPQELDLRGTEGDIAEFITN